MHETGQNLLKRKKDNLGLRDQNPDFCSFYNELKINYVRHFLPYFPTHSQLFPSTTPTPTSPRPLTEGNRNYISEAKQMMVNAKHRRKLLQLIFLFISHNISKTSLVEPSECVPGSHTYSPTPVFSPTLSLFPLHLCFSKSSSFSIPTISFVKQLRSPHSFLASCKLHCLSCSECQWSLLSPLQIPQTGKESSHHLYAHLCVYVSA